MSYHSNNSHIYRIAKKIGNENRPGGTTNQWLKAIGRKNKDGSEWIPNNNSLICTLHFVSGKPSNDPGSLDFVPSQFPNKVSKLLNSQVVSWDRNLSLKSVSQESVYFSTNGKFFPQIDS